MALAPHSRRLLARFAEVGVLSFEQMGVLAARDSVVAGTSLMQPAAAVAQVREVLVDGAEGLLPARLYHPAPAEPRPLIVFFHGGGWMTGGVGTADPACRSLAVTTGAAVLSVDYRLAPETRAPGQLLDCLAAYRWAGHCADELAVDGGRVLVMGDSAGGTLAAGVCLMARDRGLPAPAAQVLLYPPLAPPWCTGFASWRDRAQGFGLTAPGMTWFWEHYLQTTGVPDGYVAPLLSPDLSALPPALVVTADHDPLCDEGAAYAAALQAAGTSSTYLSYHGAIHGFLSMARVLPEGVRVLDDVRDFLQVHGIRQQNS